MERLKAYVNSFERDPNIHLNELMSAEIIDGETIALHVKEMPGGKPSLGQGLNLLKDGMRTLSSALLTRPELKNVKTIIGTSWIIAEHPKLMELLGFTVGGDSEIADDEKRSYRQAALSPYSRIPSDKRNIMPAFASMSREDFIARYGIEEKGSTK